MNNAKDSLSEIDLQHLAHCLSLAEEAVNAGDKPFGSLLVNQKNEVIASARNRVNELNNLAHPEIELAHWAAKNLSAEERNKTVMYTSGEHCPMCAAAHGWVGLGGIVYLSSAKQLKEWMLEMKVPAAPIQFYPIQDIIPNIQVKGPASGKLLEGIKALHKKYYDLQADLG
ncbi:nucleoside deaminase [Arenibacter latericius]|uniref:nucleoside deaminase n=1 Tax=Arenibacter latericius TaxID=86104 RepID=UPI00041FE824|nr:nucleoside deaminase [Arenibacter latericius]MDX1362989.1 nucleoside deaminase [Arenibacter latericius]